MNKNSPAKKQYANKKGSRRFVGQPKLQLQVKQVLSKINDDYNMRNSGGKHIDSPKQERSMPGIVTEYQHIHSWLTVEQLRGFWKNKAKK